jgi:AcrR family transcriptional regulator
VARWAPGARGRLQSAAFELYTQNGFEQTTVADIAARAGVTERTFYRYFADKREVFFDGAQDLQDFLVRAVEANPPDVAPLDVVAEALRRAAREIFADRSVLARQRQALIEANPELLERELVKMARLAGALSAALRAREVKEPAASVAAETGIALFRIAFARWVDERNTTGLDDLITSALGELRAVAAPR